MSLCIVGSVAFDSIETPFGSVDRILGGSAPYASLSASFLTEPVRLSAVVGGDFPDEHVETLQDRGIDTEGLERDPEGKTFFWAGRYHYDLNTRDTLATHLNVLEDFQPTLPASYSDTRILCLGNLDPTVQASVLDQLNPELVILDTMNFWIENTPEALGDVLQRVDVLVINDEEAREISGEANLIRASKQIRDGGPPILIIKKGENGALLFVEDVIFWVPAHPLEKVIDPTGAGDSFMGGFAGHLARRGDFGVEALKEALVVGSVLASFCVEAFGPERLLTLSPEDIDRRIDEFTALASIPENIEPVQEQAVGVAG